MNFLRGEQGSPPSTRISMSLLLFIVLSGLLSSTPVTWAGEMYRWIDEKGTVHFTDDLSKIPPQYFDRARKIDTPERPPVQGETPRSSETEDDRVKKYLEEFDRKVETKKKYERRVSELQEELTLIEERLKEIEELEREDYEYYIPFRDPRTGKFVAVASPYYDEKVRLTKRMEIIRAEINSLEEKIDQIKRSL
jgi:predicted ribosome quality control (RQC) complex YloA/Tae2 family protein